MEVQLFEKELLVFCLPLVGEVSVNAPAEDLTDWEGLKMANRKEKREKEDRDLISIQQQKQQQDLLNFNPKSGNQKNQKENQKGKSGLREEDMVNQDDDFISSQGQDEEDEDEESLNDMNLEKEEDIQTLLTELNDTAISALRNEDNDNALECLKRGEQLLEAVTAEGKDVDRNLIIVVLYNLACCYQRMSMLEDCASYLDGTIYNLEAKITNFDDNESIIQMMLQNQTNPLNQFSSHSMNSNTSAGVISPNNVTETTKKFNISSKLFKLRYQCKCHLQLCAVLSQLNKHQEALYHGQLASFFCQELIKNTLLLCQNYIQRLLQEKNSNKGKGVLKDIENELESSSVESDIFGRRTSYYVEENEKILNLLITNCEPILQEIVLQVNHFNTYNKIKQVTDKAQIDMDEISIQEDCILTGQLFNHATLLQNAQTNSDVPQVTHQSYKKLKNTYLGQIKQTKPVSQQFPKRPEVIDEVVPDEFEKKKKVQLNESTYYNTAGQDGQKQSTYFTSLKNNVKTILGVKEQDDWIFNLNIGNVMHLLPMSLEELNLHIDNSHELSRDAMLEKIILLAVSYFCVGTELRFLSTAKETKPQKNIYGEVVNREEKITKADSEKWHAMALESSGTFLPSECPLVSHIIMSYQKHHSPAMTTIPEDAPLIEDLKVVRPLNEIKNDMVNYHQIIRSHNTANKVGRISSQPVQKQSKAQILQRSLTKNQEGTPYSYKQTSGRKKIPQEFDLNLQEADDQSEFAGTKKQQIYTQQLNSPQFLTQSHDKIPRQPLANSIKHQAYQSNQAHKPPTVPHSKGVHQSRNYITQSESQPVQQKRPKTASGNQKKEPSEIQNKLMQTATSSLKSKLHVDLKNQGNYKTASRVSSASSQKRSNNNSTARKTPQLKMSGNKLMNNTGSQTKKRKVISNKLPPDANAHKKITKPTQQNYSASKPGMKAARSPTAQQMQFSMTGGISAQGINQEPQARKPQGSGKTLVSMQQNVFSLQQINLLQQLNSQYASILPKDRVKLIKYKH